MTDIYMMMMMMMMRSEILCKCCNVRLEKEGSVSWTDIVRSEEYTIESKGREIS